MTKKNEQWIKDQTSDLIGKYMIRTNQGRLKNGEALAILIRAFGRACIERGRREGLAEAAELTGGCYLAESAALCIEERIGEIGEG